MNLLNKNLFDNNYNINLLIIIYFRLKEDEIKSMCDQMNERDNILREVTTTSLFKNFVIIFIQIAADADALQKEKDKSSDHFEQIEDTKIEESEGLG